MPHTTKTKLLEEEVSRLRRHVIRLERQRRDSPHATRPINDDADEGQSRERSWLSRLYRDAPVGLCCFDTQLRYIDIDRWLAAFNGLSVEEHIGRSVGELFPELAEGIEPQLRHVIETGQPILEGSVFTETPSQPGVKRHFQHNYVAVESEDGSIVGVSCSVVEITERKWAEEALRVIVEGTSRTFGGDFFRSLVRDLATVLEVRFAFVSETHEDCEERLRLLAYWKGNDFAENFEYEIKGSPCEHVIKNGFAHYPENVQQIFPDDLWLKETSIESYLAISFADPNGKPLGHLGVAHDKPMQQSLTAESILQVFASRTGAELLRGRANVALNNSRDELEIRVEQRTAELEETNRKLRSEIADRKQVERRETQLGRIVEESLDEIFIFDAKTLRFLQANHGARENLGYSMQELSAMTPFDVKPQMTTEKFREIAAPLLNDGRKRVDFETVHRRKDGSLYNVEAHLQLAELHNKRVFVAFVRDITDRKRAEEALLQSEQQSRELLENQPDGVGVVVDGRIAFANLSMAELTGYTREEMIGRQPTEFLIPNDRERAGQFIEHIIKGGPQVATEYTILRKDSSTVPVEILARRISFAGKPALLSVIRDVTERKQAEEALSRANHEWYESFDALPDHLCVLDRSGAILRANRTMRERFEPIHGNLIGLDYRLIYCGTTTPDPQPPCAAVLETGKPVHCESQLPTMDGWYGVSSYPIFDENKQQWGAVSVVTDITSKWEAQNSLRVSEQRFRTLVEHAPEAIVVHDVESNRFVDVNQNAIDLFKLDRESLLKIGPAEISAPTQSNGRPSRKLAQEFTERTLAGEVPVFEWTFLDAEGNEIPTEVRLVCLPSADRKLVRGSITDITELKQLEKEAREQRERLAQVTRLSTMGEMATSLAHELNQPLAAISTYCFVGEQALADAGSADLEQLRELFEKSAGQALRAGEIIRRLRAFVDKRDSVRLPVDVAKGIEDVLQLLEPDLRQSEVRIEQQTDHSNCIASIDEVQIQQVLVNLIRNALDAMSETESGERTLKITTTQTTDGLIEVAIRDTGKGVPPEKKDRIFDAFFTTKPEGMGMGLAISRTIIESHGGRLWMTLNSDCGVTFHITLPVAKGESDDDFR